MAGVGWVVVVVGAGAGGSVVDGGACVVVVDPEAGRVAGSGTPAVPVSDATRGAVPLRCSGADDPTMASEPTTTPVTTSPAAVPATIRTPRFPTM